VHSGRVVTLATGLLAGALLTTAFIGARQDRPWFALDGHDWAAMDGSQRTAWMQGFVAGRAVGQLPDAVVRDTAALALSVPKMQKSGELVFPFAPSLYASRMNDYYHWDNHQPTPLWRAMLELNSELKQ
jgi:hypothetical protein